MAKRKFTCPVCGFAALTEPHVDPMGSPSYAICPCCGIEFGNDDENRTHVQLRAEWLAKGSPWWSERQPPPSNWNASEQLNAAGFNVGPN